MAEESDSKPKSALAEDRTDFAEDRTVMAAERTFAGWMRTAFAAIGIGLAFRGLFGELDPPWLARAIATLFMSLGAVLALSAALRASRTLKRLHTHNVAIPKSPNFWMVAIAIAIGTAILIAAIWLANGL